jgi:hypothetical protein
MEVTLPPGFQFPDKKIGGEYENIKVGLYKPTFFNITN